MKIGLDMMGGDYAPLEAVKGVSIYLSENVQPAHIVMIGDQVKLKELADLHKIDPSFYTIVHAGG
jgi:glycerol-3-phosphate acyltransferase PlsX